MNFDLSDEQALFQASVERFAAALDGEARRRLRESDGGYPRERWSELAGLGLIALAVNERQGGMGGEPSDLVVVAEAFGRTIAPDPWLENGVLPAVLLAAARRDDLLGGVLSGEVFAAFAFAERSQRFNLRPGSTVARRHSGGFAVDGAKTFVLGGGLADRLIVLADLEGEARLFVVPTNSEGVLRRLYRLVDGSIACEVRFAEVAVPPEAELAVGSAELAGCVALVRLLAAAEMLGLAQRLFADTLAYVKQREQFGVAIGSFQAIQHRLVECYAALEQGRSMVYRAALADRRDPAAWNRTAAGAKAYIATQADLIAREAVQMHGGMGVTDELAIGHAMKRVLLLATLFGDKGTTLSDYAEAA